MKTSIIKITFSLLVWSELFGGQVRSAFRGPVYEPLTTSQWSERFRCDSNRTQEDNCQRSEPKGEHYCSREESVCSRAPTDWMWKYVDELEPEFQVLIREKSIDERLANMIYAMISTRGFDRRFSVVRPRRPQDESKLESLLIGPQVNETLCRRQLGQMLALSREFGARVSSDSSDEPLEESHIRLARVLDSFGRYESGYLSGRYQSFGAYEQCITTQLKLDQQKLVGMRYCWAHLDLQENLSADLRSRKRRSYEHTGGTLLSTGVCLPESCHSKSLVSNKPIIQELLDGQFKFPPGIYRRQSMNISSLECVADSQSPIASIQTGGKILLAILAAWICFATFATYSCRTSGQITSKKGALGESSGWLRSVSLVDSWNEFIEAKGSRRVSQDQHISLDVLNPIKVLAMLMFTLAHAVVFQLTQSNGQLRDAKMIDLDASLQVIFAFPMVVESFFVLTGILVTYIALKKHRVALSKREGCGEGKGMLNYATDCFKFVVSRYLRIYPLFYLAFALKKGVFVHLGRGPTWNHGLNQHLVSQCQDLDWFGPLRLISFTYNLNNERACLPQTYTITCDLMFVLLVAPLVYSINRFPRTVIGVSLLCTFASTLACILAVESIEKSVLWPLANMKTHAVNQVFSSGFGDIYMFPDYRLGSIMFGVIAGYFIYKYEETLQQVEQTYSIAPRWLLKGLTWFSLAFFSLILLGSALKNEAPMQMRLDPKYMAVIRLLWAFTTALVLLRLVTEWSQSKRLAWMKSKSWKILAKLNYSILLVHLDLLNLDLHTQTNETYLSKYNLTKTFLFAYSVSMALGIVLYVLFENPIDNLVKKCLSRF